jgi:hypothetical protein
VRVIYPFLKRRWAIDFDIGRRYFRGKKQDTEAVQKEK